MQQMMQLERKVHFRHSLPLICMARHLLEPVLAALPQHPVSSHGQTIILVVVVSAIPDSLRANRRASAH